MKITDRKVIKKYEYAQINLITNSNGIKFIEKTQFHIPPVIPLTFQYDYDELEVIESIIKPLEIPHARVIDSIKNGKSTTIIMEFINGINCENEPKAEYLYIAAEKIGALYYKSKININRLDKDVLRKYILTKEKALNYIDIINKHCNLPPMESLIHYIFKEYENKTMFVDHGDIQFKNFIYNDDLHLIDWDGQIHPFFSDLHSLISLASEVDADIDEIKKRYLKFSKINSISNEDIIIGGIINGIIAVFSLLIFDCPIEWIVDSYNGLQYQIMLLNNYNEKNL